MYWRRLGFVAGWTAVFSFFCCTTAIAVFAAPINGSDFGVYLSAAEALRHDAHASIYSISTLASTYTIYGGCPPIKGAGYLYQPLLAVLLEPLTFLPCGWAIGFWQASGVIAWLGCAAWFTRRAFLRAGKARALAIAFIMTLYLPIMDGLLLGQIHLILLAIIVASLMLVERGWRRTAGALLAFGVFLKYLPIMLIGYYTLRGNWRVTQGAILGGVIMGIFEILVVGPQLVLESVRGASSGLRSAEPYTIAAHIPYTGLIASVTAVLFILGVTAVSILAGGALRRMRDAERLGEGWALATMTLLSPLVWWHYLTWLLPVFAAILLAATELPYKKYSRTAMFLLALAYALAQWPYVPVFYLGVYILWLVCGALFLFGSGINLQWVSRRGISDGRLTGVEEHRVDPEIVPLNHEVQMGAGGVPGRALESND